MGILAKKYYTVTIKKNVHLIKRLIDRLKSKIQMKKIANIKALEAVTLIVGITTIILLLSYAAYQRGFKYGILVACLIFIVLIIIQNRKYKT